MRKTIVKHSRKSEPILLRDILPKVMSDIRLRMAVQKTIESRAIVGSGARGNRWQRKTPRIPATSSRIKSLPAHVSQNGRTPGTRAEIPSKINLGEPTASTVDFSPKTRYGKISLQPGAARIE